MIYTIVIFFILFLICNETSIRGTLIRVVLIVTHLSVTDTIKGINDFLIYPEIAIYALIVLFFLEILAYLIDKEFQKIDKMKDK